jgi:hypothetical protein
LIARSEWMSCAGEVAFADREDVYLGLDLSSTIDLTALIMASASEPVRIRRTSGSRLTRCASILIATLVQATSVTFSGLPSGTC